jgi:hypothetical protein
MSRTGRPASYPDIVMYKHTLPIVWRGTIRSEGVAVGPAGHCGPSAPVAPVAPVAPDGATGPPDLRELEVTPAHKVQ